MRFNNDQNRKIVFDSGGGFLPMDAVFLVGAIVAVAAIASTTMLDGSALAILLIVPMLLLAVWRQSIVEFDIGTKRLKVVRELCGRWSKTKVDCSFDECETLGIIEYNHEGPPSFGAFFQLKNGNRHAIPLRASTFAEASETMAALSSATGISSVRLERQGPQGIS